jgi:hypothetical protein
MYIRFREGLAIMKNNLRSSLIDVGLNVGIPEYAEKRDRHI